MNKTSTMEMYDQALQLFKSQYKIPLDSKEWYMDYRICLRGKIEGIPELELKSLSSETRELEVFSVAVAELIEKPASINRVRIILDELMDIEPSDFKMSAGIYFKKFFLYRIMFGGPSGEMRQVMVLLGGAVYEELTAEIVNAGRWENWYVGDGSPYEDLLNKALSVISKV